MIERAATELFADRGYRGAAMGAIAARAGVTVPVLYDHFASKEALHRHLLEKHYDELRDVWAGRLAVRDGPVAERVAQAVDAWFAHVEANPAVARMLFRETVGDEHAEQVRREVAEQSKAAAMPLLGPQEGVVATGDDALLLELVWELVRGALQALAVWWTEHPDVPRERVVGAATAVLWGGLERLST